MIDLIPMTDTQFSTFLQTLTHGYAQDHVKAGNWSADEAQARAEEQLQELITDGLATPNHYFFAIQETSIQTQVGVLWIATRERGGRPSVFIYDIEIFQDHQRQGYAAQTMRALESKAKMLGATEVTLHVFGSNEAAKSLYYKMGYAAVDIFMAKPI